MEDCHISEPFLSVVIPAYNEELRILPTLGEIGEYLQTVSNTYEILVVDDGSVDDTAGAVERAASQGLDVRLLRNDGNRGKGAAVRRGVLEARGRYILLSDADLSTPIKEADRLLEALNSYDIAIGSRGLRTSIITKHQPFYREKMGKTFNVLVRLVAVPGIKDTQCGFKCFRREVARDLFSRQKAGGFSFDVEILYLATRLGYSIAEVPVRWENSPASRVRVVRDSLRMLLDLFMIRWVHRRVSSRQG